MQTLFASLLAVVTILVTYGLNKAFSKKKKDDKDEK